MAAGAVAGGAMAQGQGSTVTCPHCNAQVRPGKFCAECGGNIAVAAKKNCTGCGVELAAGARFCPECGTPSVPPAAPAQR
jgi:membrane protease subunit (stomatin/prohibitin family)